ncbi:MAG: Holliday junction resolvase RuvX [Microthrixaceae bacterium]
MTADDPHGLAGLPPLSQLRALGVDPGTVRIGVAVGAAGVATPVTTIVRTNDRQGDLRRLAKLVADYEVDVVVVGLPVSLDGRLAGAAKRTLSEVKLLRRLLSVPVTTYDERFSTVTAEQSLHQLDLTGPGRRAVVDQVAAAVILQGWLDARANLARPQDHSGVRSGEQA